MSGTAATLTNLVDRRTGIVTELEAYQNPPEWPSTFVMVAGHVANANRADDWPADRMSTGMGFGPHDRVVAAALGEAAERYCANFVPDRLPLASYEALAAGGVAAIDPASVLLYSAEQYRRPGFPYVPFERELPVRWVQGRGMTDHRPVLAPASLVFANYHATRYPGEPRTNALLYAGLAAGPDRAEAEISAMAEIIERDAVEIWWRSGGRPLAVPPSLLAGVREALVGETEQFEFTVLGIPNRWRVPVLAVVLYDPELAILTVGTAARPSVQDAALKAAAEAISLRSYSKGLLSRDGGAWAAVGLGLFGAERLAPYRADRAYAASFAQDFSDMHDLCCNSQYYLDRRALETVLRLRHPHRVLHPEELGDVGGDVHRTYRERLAGIGWQPVSVELTTADVAACGVSVVRVLAPGTYSNAPAAAPLLAGDRWLEEPLALGLSDQRPDPQRPVPPLPHT